MNIHILAEPNLYTDAEVAVEFMNANLPSSRCTISQCETRKGIIDFDHEIEDLISNHDIKNRKDEYFFLTQNRFDDNYFYHGFANINMISFWGWDKLTDVPTSNGICFQIVRCILKHTMAIGENHDDSTGCINDYMWDKSIIDITMRSGLYCAQCIESYSKSELRGSKFIEFSEFLKLLAHHSRKNIPIVSENNLPVEFTAVRHFDVFLCHNSQDKDVVRRLNEELKSFGIRTWLDEESIDPGDVWQDVLERDIKNIGCCLVLCGDSGEGPWQEMERRAFIAEFVRRGCRIVPVFIGRNVSKPTLPLLLSQFMWSDLSKDRNTGLARLVRVIKNASGQQETRSELNAVHKMPRGR